MAVISAPFLVVCILDFVEFAITRVCSTCVSWDECCIRCTCVILVLNLGSLVIVMCVVLCMWEVYVCKVGAIPGHGAKATA